MSCRADPLDCKSEAGGADRCGRQRFQVFRQLPVDPGPQGAGADLGLGGGDFNRHDEVRFYLHHPAARLPGHLFPPGLLVPQVAAVADDEGGLPAQRQGDLRGRARAHRQADAAPREGCAGLREALQHEGVVPQVRFRIIVRQPEADHHPAAQPIGLLNAILQRVVHLRALGLLHPVKDVATLNDLTVI